jgi:hypothetical protein
MRTDTAKYAYPVVFMCRLMEVCELNSFRQKGEGNRWANSNAHAATI